MIQVIHRAFDIIEYIAEDVEREYPLREIADHFGLNHATCANIIKTLVTRGYLEQAAKKHGYKLGFQIYKITRCFSPYKDLIDAVRAPMKKLSKEINEGTILAVIRDEMRILLHEEKCINELQVNMYPEKPVYATSTGRMILAYYDERMLETFVNRFGLPKSEVWPEVEDFEDLQLELGRIRKKEISIQESRHHIVGLAVPIFEKGKAVAALGTYMPMSRFKGERTQMVIDKLVATGREINQYNKEFEKEAILGKNTN